MPVYSKEDSEKLLRRFIVHSKADEIMVRLAASSGGNIRYAGNAVSTAGDSEESSVVITSAFGKRSGSVTTNEFDEQSIKTAIALSEELARLSPENPEYMSMLPMQHYSQSINFNTSTAATDANERADQVLKSITVSKENNLEGAGYLENNTACNAVMNSKGLFAYNKGTSIEFSVTLRNDAGTGSGYAVAAYNDAALLNTRHLTQAAAKKAVMSAEAREIPPGKYTVILEPLAVENILSYMVLRFDAREADEGRSFLSRKGGGTKEGEKLFDESLTIYSDPLHPLVPTAPFNSDGEPIKKTVWVENGVIKNLSYPRYWAQQKGRESLPAANNIVIEGGDSGIDELILGTDKGILVSRFWYIRLVDQQTVLLTGLTRDGTFYIENGKIKYPVKNFRFNESPVAMLGNIVQLGKSERAINMVVPAMKIGEFNFTSVSDAV